MDYPVVANRFDGFLSQVRQIKPLSPEREHELAVRYKESGDREAAQEMIIAHLPFVVKIAYRYRHYMLPMPDLVQEGTIGLMKALKRFDPDKGYRLISFAVHWIKAYVKNFIIKSWSLVKVGTTQAQRKLFYRMGAIGEHADAESKSQRVRDLAEDLKVKEDDVIEMEARIKARDWSLDEAFSDDGKLAAVDFIEDHSPDQEALMVEKETEAALTTFTKKAINKLDPREQFIITKRFYDDPAWTLQKLGNHFGTSRERIRQLETRALGKLRKELAGPVAQGLLPV